MNLEMDPKINPKESLKFKVTYKGRPVQCNKLEVEYDLETKDYIYLDGGKKDE